MHDASVQKDMVYLTVHGPVNMEAGKLDRLPC